MEFLKVVIGDKFKAKLNGDIYVLESFDGKDMFDLRKENDTKACRIQLNDFRSWFDEEVEGFQKWFNGVMRQEEKKRNFEKLYKMLTERKYDTQEFKELYSKTLKLCENDTLDTDVILLNMGIALEKGKAKQEEEEIKKGDIGYIFTYKNTKVIIKECKSQLNVSESCKKCVCSKENTPLCNEFNEKFASCHEYNREDGKSVYFEEYKEDEVDKLKSDILRLEKERDEARKLFEEENAKLGKIMSDAIQTQQAKDYEIIKNLDNDKANLKDTIKLLDERVIALNDKLSSIRIITNGLKKWGSLEVEMVCKAIIGVLDEK